MGLARKTTKSLVGSLARSLVSPDGDLFEQRRAVVGSDKREAYDFGASFVTLSGSEVTACAGRLGVATLTRPTASGPTWAAAGLGGLPTATFDGIDNQLSNEAGDLALASGSRPAAYLVCRHLNLTGDRFAFIAHSTAFLYAARVLTGPTNAFRTTATLSDGTPTDNSGAEDTDWHRWGANCRSTGFETMDDGSVAATATEVGTLSAAANNLFLGCNQLDGSFGNVEIAYLDFDSDVPTAAEYTAGDNAAAAAYGL